MERKHNEIPSETQVANELNFDDLEKISGGGVVLGSLGFLYGGLVASLEGKSPSETLATAATVGAFGAVFPEP